MAPAASPSSAEPSDPSGEPDPNRPGPPAPLPREPVAELRSRLPAEVAERERVEQALRASEARARRAENRLRQAIESVAAAIALWDADDRLVLANQRYLDLYPAVAEHVRPGVAFADLARALAASGSIPEAVGREEAWLAERLERQRTRPGEPFERQLADGRWVRISDHRTAEGGLVTLHSDVTELKRQAEELRAREAQLRGIVDNIPGVVYRRIRHPDGRISYPYHSPQIELRHGFDAAAVANDARVLQDAVHPEDRAAWLAAIERSAEQFTPFEGDYRISVRGGEFRWFRTLATPVRHPDGSVVWDGVSIDVSELKATEQALRDSEERYRRLIEAGPIALLTHRGGRVSFANAKALELFGTTRSGDLVGRALLALAYPEDRSIARELSRRRLPSEHAEGPRELRIVRLDGRVIDVEAVSVGIIERGEPAAQVVLLDITARKRVEQRVRHLAHHDALTACPTARCCSIACARRCARRAASAAGSPW
jgi:PAS domain S-box-containing protein